MSMKNNKQNIMIFNILLVVNLMFKSIIEIDAFIAIHQQVVTGNITYVCAFFREKDLSIDDIRMPEILTFCSCAVIHKSWVLTSRQCYVQLHWFVSAITKQFTAELPENLHKIEEIYDKRELTLVKVSPEFKTETIDVAQSSLSVPICELYGFSPPNNEALRGDDESLIYKVWFMKGDLLKTEILVLNYLECLQNYKNLSLSPYIEEITYTTLCVNPLNTKYLKPCSFDRGAPIICDGKLQGVLVYNKPAISKVPLHLPSSCYANFDDDYTSFYAEGITIQYANWISNVLL